MNKKYSEYTVYTAALTENFLNKLILPYQSMSLMSLLFNQKAIQALMLA